MAIYEFITVERTDGPFEVPGTIEEILDNDPHSKQKFTALVRLDSDAVEEDESDVTIDFADLEGVGETVATRIKAAGITTKSDVLSQDPKDMADEVKGLSANRAEDIMQQVEGDHDD